MKFRVESWSAEYGPSSEGVVESEVETRTEVEVAGPWSPIGSSVPAASDVLFVDGVRRIDANLWIEQPDDVPVLGAAAVYAAGAVRCNQTAEIVDARVERGLFTSAPGASDIVTAHDTYRVYQSEGSAPEQLWLRIQERMRTLEGEVSAGQTGAGLVVVDGPLSHHHATPAAIGYVKTHHVHYLPPERRSILLTLPPRTRTPMFLIGGGSTRFSWYLRLAEAPGPTGGLVRCEVAANLSMAGAVELADRVSSTLPRFASQPHKDPRAPQNLYPIAGLENHLRRRLGDQAIMERALRRAAGPELPR